MNWKMKTFDQTKWKKKWFVGWNEISGVPVVYALLENWQSSSFIQRGQVFTEKKKFIQCHFTYLHRRRLPYFDVSGAQTLEVVHTQTVVKGYAYRRNVAQGSSRNVDFYNHLRWNPTGYVVHDVDLCARESSKLRNICGKWESVKINCKFFVFGFSSFSTHWRYIHLSTLTYMFVFLISKCLPLSQVCLRPQRI